MICFRNNLACTVSLSGQGARQSLGEARSFSYRHFLVEVKFEGHPATSSAEIIIRKQTRGLDTFEESVRVLSRQTDAVEQFEPRYQVQPIRPKPVVSGAFEVREQPQIIHRQPAIIEDFEPRGQPHLVRSKPVIQGDFEIVEQPHQAPPIQVRSKTRLPIESADYHAYNDVYTAGLDQEDQEEYRRKTQVNSKAARMGKELKVLPKEAFATDQEEDELPPPKPKYVEPDLSSSEVNDESVVEPNYKSFDDELSIPKDAYADETFWFDEYSEFIRHKCRQLKFR